MNNLMNMLSSKWHLPILGILMLGFSVASVAKPKPQNEPTPKTGDCTLDYITELITAEEWDDYFPHRYGTPGHGEVKTGDFYSYDSFVEAIHEMAKIKIKKERLCNSNLEIVYRWIGDDNTGSWVEITRTPFYGDGWGGPEIDTEIYDYGKFLNDGDYIVRKRELMAFLANISKEGTGGWPTAPGGKYAWGLYYREELMWSEICPISCENKPNGDSSGGYRDETNINYPPAPNKSYHGRGPMQISYNYNYGQASEIIYRDKNIWLNNPEKVLENGVEAFKAAIWFWMTPQYPKPSCHDVMTYKWAPTPTDLAQGRKNGFGATIMIINGGVECNGGSRDADRVAHYKYYCEKSNTSMDLDGTNNMNSISCNNMTEFIIDGNECPKMTPRAVMTAPANKSVFASGDNVTMRATASAYTGSTVSKVEFYEGFNKLGDGVLTGGAYTFTWNNPVDGSYTIYAKVTANNTAYYHSDLIGIVVGEQPVRPPRVYIITPAPFQVFSSLATVKLSAIVDEPSGLPVVSVEIFLKKDTDPDFSPQGDVFTSEPYEVTVPNLGFGAYKVKAVAINSCGGKGESEVTTFYVIDEPVVSSNIVIAGYLQNWDYNGAPYVKLRDVNPKYNTIKIAFGKVASDFATINFVPGMQSKTDFKMDIKIKQGAGNKILLSIGDPGDKAIGYNVANDPIYKLSLADATARNKFINSVKAIIDEYGFDGIDIMICNQQSLLRDPNDNNPLAPTTPKIINLISALKELTTFYRNQGKDFWLTISPMVENLQMSFAQGYSNGSWVGSYIPIINGLRNELTFVSPQYYNATATTALDGGQYSAGTGDFLVAMSEMLTRGFSIAGNGNAFAPLREDQVVLGVLGHPNVPGGGYVEPDVLYSSLEYLIEGKSFGGRYILRKPSGWADVRGISIWNISWDEQNGNGIVDNGWEYFFGDPTNKLPVVTLTANKTTDLALGNVILTANAVDPDGFITKIEIVNGSTILATSGDNPANGQFVYEWNNIPAGVYQVRARAYDNKDGMGLSAPLTITIISTVKCSEPEWIAGREYCGGAIVSHKDHKFRAKYCTTAEPNSEDLWGAWEDQGECTQEAGGQPPRVFISSPASGTKYFPAPATVPLVADAQGTDGTVTGVEFFEGNTKLGNGVREGTTNNWNFTWNNVALGTHLVKAKATDNNNLSFTSGEIEIIVQDEDDSHIPNNPPSVQWVTPPTPEDGDEFTMPVNIPIEILAADERAVTSVRFYVSGAEQKTWNGDLGTYTHMWTPTSPGTYQMMARAWNGNTLNNNSSTEIRTITINPPVVDNQILEVEIVSPRNGATYVAPTNVTVEADVNSDTAIEKVVFVLSDNSQGILSEEDVVAEPYTFTFTELPVGNYVVGARAVDVNGKVAISNTVGFQVYDIPAPEVRMTSPQDNYTTVAPASITLDASVGMITGQTVVSLEYLDSNNADTRIVLLNNPTSYQYQMTNVLAGLYRPYVRVRYSNDMIVTSAPITFTITEPDVPNTPPLIALNTPLVNEEFQSPATVIFRATASDVDEGDYITKVEFYSGVEVVGNGVLRNGFYEYEWSPVLEGMYTVFAKAYDARGGVSSCQVRDIFVKPATGNIPPIVSITSPQDGTIFNTTSTILVEASARDLDGTVELVEFYFDGDNKFGESRTTPYRSNLAGLPVGNYTITAVATDNDDAQTISAPINIKVSDPMNNIPPVVSIISPLPGQLFYAPADYQIVADAYDIDGYITKVEFIYEGRVVKTVANPPYTLDEVNQLEGSYYYTVRAYDDRGATSSMPVTVRVLVNDRKPSVYITAPVNGGEFISERDVHITVATYDFSEAISYVEFYGDEQLLGTNNVAPFDYMWLNVSAGEHTIQVKAFGDGEESATSSKIKINVRADAELLPPIVEIISPNEGDVFKTNQTIMIEAIASSPNSVIDRVEFYANNVLLYTSNTFPYQYQWSGMNPALYRLSAIAYDAVGKLRQSKTVSITVKDATLGVDCSTLAAYSSTTEYKKGDMVVWSNRVYEALMNNLVGLPPTASGGNWWKLIDVCESNTGGSGSGSGGDNNGGSSSKNDNGGLIERMYPNPITGEWLTLDINALEAGEEIEISFFEMPNMRSLAQPIKFIATQKGTNVFVIPLRDVKIRKNMVVLVKTNKGRKQSMMLVRH